MKTRTNKLIVLGLLLLLTISSCHYYKTLDLAVVDTYSVTELTKYKPYVTIAEDRQPYYDPSTNINSPTYLITDIKIINDTLFGNLKLYDVSMFHGPEYNVFRTMGYVRPLETLHLYTNDTLKDGKFMLPINRITTGNVHEKAPMIGFAASAGIAIVATGAAVGTFLLIACNCPHVESPGPNGSAIFQGSLFPGAMFKMLARDDYLVMNDFYLSGDKLAQVKVYNNLEETQYIDQVKLLEIRHEKSLLGIGANSNLISLNEGQVPSKAVSQNGINILPTLIKRDEIHYSFNDVGTQEELNSVVMSFNAQDLSNKSQLVIKASQSKWLEQTAELFFRDFGTSFHKWVDKMNDADPVKYRQHAIDQGISMNAYIKKNNEWQYFGSFETVGTVADRLVSLPIDLSGIEGEFEVKLEAAHRFWNLDQVFITSDWTDEIEVIEHPLVSAFNQDSVNVIPDLTGQDKQYVINQDSGTYVNLQFRVDQPIEGVMVLKSNGYYNHKRSYTTKPDKQALRALKKMELSSHFLSRQLSIYEILSKTTAINE